MRTTLVLALVLAAVPAMAQEQTMPTSHKIALATYIPSAALDYHSTYRVLSTPGGYERNPLGRITNDHPVGTIVFGAAVDVAATTLLYKWLAKRKPKLTPFLLFAASSVRLTLALDNYGNIPATR